MPPGALPLARHGTVSQALPDENVVFRRTVIRGVATLALFLALLGPERARADGPYEGQWREGPMSIRVDVESWGGDCGPRPQSTATDGGGVFRVSQSGDQLTFHLRTERTTRSCWSENRAVRRVSSTYQAGTWRIVCRTPTEDSRSETGTYSIQAAGDDRLQFRDVSRYDWQLNESRCLATITTTQTFTRVGSAAARPSEPTPTTPPVTTPRCTPGEPARLLLRPSTAELAPGSEQCFTTRVQDASGCAVRQRVDLAVAEGAGTLRGSCFVAAEGEGRVRIVATSGGLRDEAVLQVHTMDLGDLIARRSESGSVGSGTPELDPTATSAARVSASTEEEQVDLLLPGLALGAAALLVVFALVLLRRRGRASLPPARARAGAPTPPAAVPSSAPSEAEVDAPAEAPPTTTPSEEARPPEPPLAPAPSEAAPEDLICPECRRGYPPGAERCDHDGTALVAYRDFLAGSVRGAARKNVCPTCGAEYAATVTFCGADGSTLVPREEPSAR